MRARVDRAHIGGGRDGEGGEIETEGGAVRVAVRDGDLALVDVHGGRRGLGVVGILITGRGGGG